MCLVQDADCTLTETHQAVYAFVHVRRMGVMEGWREAVTNLSPSN